LLRRPKYFNPPTARAFWERDAEYLPGYPTYTAYNYSGGGLVARVKTAHFEAALELTRDLHGEAGAVDFGCADGVFIPSLARIFPRVYAVDIRPDMTAIAERVRMELKLENVQVVCNRDRDFTSLAQDMRAGDYRVAFLLETLEHVGDARRLYESKMDFVDGVLGLLEPDGRVVISVPKMTGVSFLVQRGALRLLGMHREAIGCRDLFNAVVRRNTDALEPVWTSAAHLGFNHLKLERYLSERFRVTTSRSTGFTQVFVITRL
jgi:hypothetical protein